MTAPHADFNSDEPAMISFWLPPDARSNGLSALRWAEIVVVSAVHAEQLLAAFRAAGVPACAAPLHGQRLGEQDTRVWVDPGRFAEAENVLLRELSR
jgi:hypothetical protein